MRSLRREVEPLLARAASIHHEEWTRFRGFHSFEYGAETWSRSRRVVARIEATALGTDARFVVTDLEGAGAKVIYETLYCDRGNGRHHPPAPAEAGRPGPDRQNRPPGRCRIA